MHLILSGGRVIDPATGHDAVADVRILDGRIDEIAASLEARGAEVIDVTGLIVGPGFIDLHSHVHSIAGHRLQAMDGVTTALDLEAGMMPVAEAIARAEMDGRPLNYGFSASWAQARALAHLDREPVPDMEASMQLLGDPQWQRSSSPAERRRWLGALEQELAAGALGIGILMGYAPRAEPFVTDVTPYLGTYTRAGVTTDILERDGTLVMRSTMTGPLAEMLPDPVQEHVLTPVKEGEFALRQEGQQNWNSLVFYTLPTGEPYMHFGVRAAPKVAS